MHLLIKKRGCAYLFTFDSSKQVLSCVFANFLSSNPSISQPSKIWRGMRRILKQGESSKNSHKISCILLANDLEHEFDNLHNRLLPGTHFDLV